MEEMVTNDDNEGRVMPYNPKVSYKMAILSAVAYDQSHPQHCLDQYLPSAKFQLQTFVTKNCDFLDNKCSGYAGVSQALRALVVSFPIFKIFHAVGAPNSNLSSESVNPSVCFGSCKLM